MNFYIGNSIQAINIKESSVELSDDLIQHIYNQKYKITYNMNILFSIDPYSDTEISNTETNEIFKIFNFILNSSLLDGYDNIDEAKMEIQALINLLKEAINRDEGIVVIGD